MPAISRRCRWKIQLGLIKESVTIRFVIKIRWNSFWGWPFCPAKQWLLVAGWPKLEGERVREGRREEDGGASGRETGSSLGRVCNDQQNSSAELEPSSFRLASSWMIPRNVVQGSSNNARNARHHVTRGIMLDDFTSGPLKTLVIHGGAALCGLDVACSNPFRWIVDTGACGIVCVRYGYYGL